MEEPTPTPHSGLWGRGTILPRRTLLARFGMGRGFLGHRQDASDAERMAVRMATSSLTTRHTQKADFVIFTDSQEIMIRILDDRTGAGQAVAARIIELATDL